MVWVGFAKKIGSGDILSISCQQMDHATLESCVRRSMSRQASGKNGGEGLLDKTKTPLIGRLEAIKMISEEGFWDLHEHLGMIIEARGWKWTEEVNDMFIVEVAERLIAGGQAVIVLGEDGRGSGSKKGACGHSYLDAEVEHLSRAVPSLTMRFMREIGCGLKLHLLVAGGGC